jgi:hypothetical protein
VNPINWYWLADDGRIFSSASQSLVTVDNPAYVAWSHTYQPTAWPVDDAGAQTDEALQDVLRPYDIYVNLAYYTGGARQKKIAGDIVVNGLPFSTDPLTYGSLNSAYIYTIDKQSDTFSWKLPDGSFITLNTADIKALQNAANQFAQSCFACEDTTLDGIETGTITTRAQVDAAFAAISNSFTGLSADDQLQRRHMSRAAKAAAKQKLLKIR